MSQLGIGIIGYGGFGRFLDQSWSDLPDVDVTAVSDTDGDRDPGARLFFRDWRSLIQDPAVQVVAIATPPATHADIACAALDAGKHVIIEKPLATTLADAARIVRARDRTGCIATVDFMLRFNPLAQALKRFCESGRFGVLRRVAVENFAQDEDLPEGHWFWDRAQSGGILVEHAVHFMDLVSWCSGSPAARVEGVEARRSELLTDRMMATVVHENGLIATHFHSFQRPRLFERTSMRFAFDLADVEWTGWIPECGRLTALTTEQSRKDLDWFPGCQIEKTERIDQVHGATAADLVSGRRRVLRSGGIEYDVEEIVEATFSAQLPKLDLYARHLRDLAADVVLSVREPGRRPLVTLEDGVAAIRTALLATAHAGSPRAEEKS
jgi:predicted dehydrogenase